MDHGPSEKGLGGSSPDARLRDRFGARLREKAVDSSLERNGSVGALWRIESRDLYSLIWRTWARWVSLAGAVVAILIAILTLALRLTGFEGFGPTVAGFRAVPATFTAVVLALAGTGLLLLRPVPVSVGRRKLADLLGVITCVLSLVSMADQLIVPASGVFFGDFFQDPALLTPWVMLLIGTGILVVDRDGEKNRASDYLVVAIVMSLLLAVLGPRPNLIVTQGIAFADIPLGGLVGGIGLALGFIFLRVDRGISGFLIGDGPGPAMARWLAPVVFVIPLAMAVGRGVSHRQEVGLDEVIRWFDQVVVMIALVAIIVFASRRLQRYFEERQEAIGEMREQAGVLTAMAEGVAMLRLSDERLVLTNPQFERMHGYEPGALSGSPITKIKISDPSDDEFGDWERVGESLARSGQAEFEGRARCADGSTIWVRTNAILIDDPRHGPSVIMARTDITAEHEARLARDRAESRFRDVFNQSPIGLALVRPDGSFEQVNRGFEKVTGYSAAELAELTFARITHPEDIGRDLELTAAMFAGETDGFTMEKRYVRKNGSVVWVELSAVLFNVEAGREPISLSMVRDITERREMGQTLKRLADHDPLTGLLNRRSFGQELARAVENPGRGLAVMMIDLDHFKFVNDRHGHQIGDRLIVRTAEVLKARLRDDDVLARQGGDEFVLLLREVRPAEAARVADSLVGEIAGKARVDGPGFVVQTSASIGISTCSDGFPDDPEQLIQQADIAMYEVKLSGRNRAERYDPGRSSEMTQGIDWHGRLRDALEHEEFCLYCQPLVDLDESPPTRFELFLRLADEDGSLVAPGVFLPVAERHDLIGEIDRWVVKQAIGLLEQCGNERSPDLFVNLSGQSVGDPAMVDMIEAELVRTGVEPNRLIFEVTETSAITNIDEARTFTERLHRIGCHTALDDFGSGFASFYYLKYVSWDYIKIDGEFVRSVHDDPTSQILVRALTDVGVGLGKQIVAEQVEDERSLELLKDYGVDLAQGYLLGRPAPVRIETLRLPPRETVPGWG